MNENTSLLARLAADQNGDGVATIADIGPWLFQLFVLPGNALLALTLKYAPEIAAFFELSRADFGGVLAIVAATAIWFAAVVVLGSVYSAVRSLDQSLTAWLAGLLNECRRLVRVALRRVHLGLSGHLRAGRDEEASLAFAAISLSRIEAAVLRCLTQIDNGAVLTPGELSVRLRRPGIELDDVLRRLAELELIVSDNDNLTAVKGFRIAPAGQMYLLGA